MFFHNAPRFGRTDQFADLFDQEQTTDYAIGITIMAVIIGVCFLSWGLLLMIFKCLGQQRMGFLSGTTSSSNDNNKKHSMWRRIAFGVSGLVFIIFTFTLVFLGFGNIETTTDELSVGAELVEDIFKDTSNLLDVYLSVTKEAAMMRDDVVKTLRNFTFDGPRFGSESEVATNETTPLLIPNLDVFAINDEKLLYGDVDLQEEAAIVVQQLESLDNFLAEPATEINGVLVNGEQMSSKVSDGLDEVQVRALQIGFGVPFIIIPLGLLLLMGATAKGVQWDTQKCCTTWFMTPVLAVMTVFLVVFTMAFSIGATVNSDFCMGGESQTPDETLVNIMAAQGIDSRSLQYQLVEHVVQGCDIERPQSENTLQIYEDFAVQLENATARIQAFDELMDEMGPKELARLVGSTNITVVREKTEALRAKTHEMSTTLKEALGNIACVRLYEVYDQVIHNATCDASEKGLKWIFSSLLIMAFSGMMMLTFRSVLYPSVEDNDLLMIPKSLDAYRYNGEDEDEMIDTNLNDDDSETASVAGEGQVVSA